MSGQTLDLQSSINRSSGNGEGKKGTRKMKINVPPALPTLLEQIAKAILIHQPADVFLFARDYLDALIADRLRGDADQDFSSPQQSLPDKYGWQGKSMGDGYGGNKTEEIASPMIRSVGVIGDKEAIKDNRMSASQRGKGDSLDSGLSRSNDFYGTRSGEEIYLPGQTIGDKSLIYHSSSPLLENKADEEQTEKKIAGKTEAYQQGKILNEREPIKGQISASPSSPTKILHEKSPNENLTNDYDKRNAFKSNQLGPLLFEDENDHIPFQDNYNPLNQLEDVKMIEASINALRQKSSIDISSESGEDYVPEEDEMQLRLKEESFTRDYTCGPISEEEEEIKLTHAQTNSQSKNKDQHFIPTGLMAATTTLAHSLFPKRTSAVSPSLDNETKRGGEVSNDRMPLMESSYPENLKEASDERGSFEISGYTREETSSLARSSASSPSSSVIDDKENTPFNATPDMGSPRRDKCKNSRFDDILDHGFTKEEDEEQDKPLVLEEFSAKGIEEVDDASAAEEKEPQSLKYEKLIESPLTDGDVKAIHDMFASYKPLNLVKGSEDRLSSCAGDTPGDKAYGIDNHGFKHSQEIHVPLHPNEISSKNEEKDKPFEINEQSETKFDEEENAAALLIQAMYKGYKVRKELFGDELSSGKLSPEHKRRHTEGYAKVNSPQLGQISSDEYFRPFDGDLIHKAAAKIQAGIKGYLTRKDMKDFLTTLPPNDHRFDALKKDLLKESPMGRSDSLDAQLDVTSIREPLDDEKTMSQSLSNSPHSHQSLVSASAKAAKTLDDNTNKPLNMGEKFYDVQEEIITIPKASASNDYALNGGFEQDSKIVSQIDKKDDNNTFDYPDFLDSAASVIQSAFKSFIHSKKKSSTGESEVSPVKALPDQTKNDKQKLIKDVQKPSISDEDSDTGTIKSMSRPSMEEETNTHTKHENPPHIIKNEGDTSNQINTNNETNQPSNSDVSYVYRNLNPLLTFRTDDGVFLYDSKADSASNLLDLSHTSTDKDHHPFLN